MNKKNRTNFLFSSPFLVGMGSVFNIAGNYFTFKHLSTDEETDAEAIASDWSIVGKDIQEAITTVCGSVYERDDVMSEGIQDATLGKKLKNGEG
jgi:hypothetical protein